MMMLTIFAVDSFRCIPLQLFGSFGSPFLVQRVVKFCMCNYSKSQSGFIQKSCITSVRRLIAAICKLFCISVVTPVMLGALLFFIFCIATIICCWFGGSPSSWDMVLSFRCSSTFSLMLTLWLKTS